MNYHLVILKKPYLDLILAGEKTDAIYYPAVDEMYPAGFRSSVEVEKLTEINARE